MKLTVFLAACLLCNTVMAQADKAAALEQRLSGIDTIVAQVMRDWKVAGVAIGVVYKDQLLYSKGFGFRDLEKKLPVTPGTVFPIASCTKAFTAMVVGMAAEQKLLDINQPVHRYFPELEFYTPRLTEMITAKDMMTHRTGLPRHDWMTHSKDPLPADTMIHRIRYLEPSKGIREEVQYTNLMYAALGELTKKLTGKTWSQQIIENIFQPLEMEMSSTGFNDLIKSREYSKGYFVRNDSMLTWDPSNEGPNPAGSINSSVLDMSHWLMAWINNGRYKDKQVLPAGFAREASTPQMSTPSRPNPSVPAYPDAFFGDFGYGWIVDSYRGHFHVQHSGDLPLYSSNTAFFPTDSIGIVVLVNKFNATIPELISSYIADKLLDLPYKEWSPLLLALQRKRETGNSSPATTKQQPVAAMAKPLADYTGTYYHPGYGIIKINLTDGKLSATHNDQPFAISPKGNDQFKANVPGGSLSAMANKKGKVIALSGSFETGIANIVFKRSGN